jgi:hypothetical protein
MKTRSSAGVGQKIELDFDINSLRITDAGDTYTANSPTSNEIMQNLKTTTSVNSDGTVQTSSTGRVSGSIDSSKVKGLLAKIKN